MAFPIPVQAGDIFGFRFPTSSAPHPHPGIVLRTFDGAEEREKLLAQRGFKDDPDAQICLLLMISHSHPQSGEFGELIPVPHKKGTLLDASRDIYVCYRHFDLALVPGQEMSIVSVNGPYLGRVQPEVLAY